MKIRQGFISNSSSSSFVIVGITDNPENLELIKKLVEIEKVKDEGFGGCNEGKEFLYLGGEHYYDDKEPYVPYYVGINVEDKLEDRTVADLRLEFIAKVKAMTEVELSPKDVQLHFGEVSNE